MDHVVEALAAQQAELAGILAGLEPVSWQASTRCEGWDVGDVVLHLAQTDEAAIASAQGSFTALAEGVSQRFRGAPNVDDAAAIMVASERGLSNAVLLSRWTSDAARLLAVLGAMDLSTRVTWVAGQMSARTLATTRLAETWIHTGDVADALKIELPLDDRLKLIARLAWRTLPYAFDRAGRRLAGPVAFRLLSPGGEAWTFLPEQPALTTIWGSAVDLCVVAARRVEPASTSLHGEGPDVDDVLALVRTYA